MAPLVPHGKPVRDAFKSDNYRIRKNFSIKSFKTRPWFGWRHLPESEKKPEFFEPHLSAHPSNYVYRDAALDWYARKAPDFEKLRYHTLELIRYRPESAGIFHDNYRHFQQRPDYLLEVIAALEKKKCQWRNSRSFWDLLAHVTQFLAGPSFHGSPEDETRFRRYFGIADHIALPDRPHEILAQRAVRYFERSIRAAKTDELTYKNINTTTLIELLVELGQTAKAMRVCRRALATPTETTTAGLLVWYGWLLWSEGKNAQAAAILSLVKQYDRENWGFQKKSGLPGCSTMQAEMYLGQIALQAGNIKLAEKHLLKSTRVKPCAHTKTKAFPLRLARDLVEAKRYDSVIKFCETVLSIFCPRQKETAALLEAAKSASSSIGEGTLSAQET